MVQLRRGDTVSVIAALTSGGGLYNIKLSGKRYSTDEND